MNLKNEIENRCKPIGVMDSGVGGISVLKKAVKAFPNENFVYFGDSKNAPYGTKTSEELEMLARGDIEFLIQNDCKAIIVACNTISMSILDKIKGEYNIPIVGIRPEIILADEIRETKRKKILVMTTKKTAQSEMLKNSIKEIDDKNIEVLACNGLVDIIEKGKTKGKEIEEYFDKLFETMNRDDYEVISLGCTHYPFVKETIKKYFDKDIKFIDGSDRTIKTIKDVLLEKELLNMGEKSGKVLIKNSLKEIEINELSLLLFNSEEN